MPNNTFNVTIDGQEYAENVVYPIKWSKQLDERLDETRLSVKRIKRNIIPPLTPATVTMTDKNGKQITLNTVVTTDESGEVPVGKGTYDHEIMCLEETKILEGIVVDALTFTNDLGRSYTKNPQNASLYYAVYDPKDKVWEKVKYIPMGEYKENDGSGFDFGAIIEVLPLKNPKNSNEPIIIPSIKDQIRLSRVGAFETGYTCPKLTVMLPTGNKIEKNSYSDNIVISAPLTGTYNIYYDTYTSDQSGLGAWELLRFAYTFNVIENHDPLPKWNIATVIDRVLNLAEPHLAGVEPRFTLNAEQHAEFEKIEAPEFAFTNCTLKEILDQIGGYIHGIPRLKGNVIYYDMLGGTKHAKLSDPKYNYISNMYSQDIENYCTSLDSTVDNLVCLTDTAQGTITEPYYDGYKTVRTETVYARIEENNMYIATQYPIQQIQSVKCGLVPGEVFGVGDIAEYIFEEAEYNRMSAYEDNYPTSKAYALYYTQGTKNIYGLGFKRFNPGGTAVKKYAIINILEKAMKTDIDVDKFTYPLLSFQVSYTPVFSARVQQTKQYIGDFKEPRTLVYNQGANLVETRYYGENMKGAVARMGNVDRIVTYNLYDFSLIPEIGEMYGDDYYIAGVTCELHPNVIKCMLTLSQDFNRLSQYIGINSTKRFYEVSEKQAYRRNIKYVNYIVIGDWVENDFDRSINVPFIIAHTFSQKYTHESISHMVASAWDSNDNRIGGRVLLPVISTAQGNAMVFTANYEDNYSAGVQTQHEPSGGVKGYFTNAVPYGDYYGRIHSLQLSWHESLIKSSEVNSRRSEKGMRLPQWKDDWDPGLTTFDFPDNLIVEKDGAEILSINYILEFVTNRKNYIIGSGFAANCSLVRGADKSKATALYVLPERISKFAQNVSLENATKIFDYSDVRGYTLEKKSIILDSFTPKISGKAWVIATQYGELLLGSNEQITANVEVAMPYISLRHNIYNL